MFGYLSFKQVRFIKLFLLAIFLFGLLLFLVDKLYPVSLDKVTQTSKVLKSEQGLWLYATTNQEEKWRFSVNVNKLDPLFVDLLLAFEDKRFYSHYGVDVLAMSRAVYQLVSSGHVVSGGSTITMQLARLLEPKPRTVKSKIIEIFRALQLEWYYFKDEILAGYLTLAPYGGNVEGVVAASHRYFGKLPYSLSASQSALLVSLPQSPEKNKPNKHLDSSISARNKVLALAKERKLIGEFEYTQAKNELPPTILQSYPRYAPHLAQKTLSKIPNEAHTTLNKKLQVQLEIWARSKSSMLVKDTTLSALVIRNQDGAIQAYLGSHNMFSKTAPAYIDMVQAIRSPGSTLKAFIYTLGFDKHIIHPNTLILDNESRFGNYMPRNFSYRFTGEVDITNALQRSLNIPAVKVLKKIGVQDFITHLEIQAGKLHIPKNKASLPVALGGLGISLWQLSQLYVNLANLGQEKKIHYLKQKIVNSQSHYFDKKSAKQTTAILRSVPAPQGFVDLQHQIAYKTGTSYGYRDVWTAAYDNKYTVVVWLGKPNNNTQLRLTGKKIAAPLAFEIFSLLKSVVQPYENWSWRVSDTKTKVPAGLKYFDRTIQKGQAKLAFVYPVENSRFRSASCNQARVKVKVENGVPPYYWYVDGLPEVIESNYFDWSFDQGAHTLNVIDSEGATQIRNIWVDKPDC